MQGGYLISRYIKYSRAKARGEVDPGVEEGQSLLLEAKV